MLGTENSPRSRKEMVTTLNQTFAMVRRKAPADKADAGMADTNKKAATNNGQFFGFNSAPVLAELATTDVVNVATKAYGATLEGTASSWGRIFVDGEGGPWGLRLTYWTAFIQIQPSTIMPAFGPTADFKTTGCELKVRLSKKYSVSHVGIYFTKESVVNPPKIKVSGEAGEAFSFEVNDKMSQYFVQYSVQFCQNQSARGLGAGCLQLSCNTQVESTRVLIRQERKEGALEQVQMHRTLHIHEFYRAVSSIYRGDRQPETR